MDFRRIWMTRGRQDSGHHDRQGGHAETGGDVQRRRSRTLSYERRGRGLAGEVKGARAHSEKMSAPNLLLRKVNSVWKGGWNVGRAENGRNKRNKRNKTEAAGVFGILPDTAVSGNPEKDL